MPPRADLSVVSHERFLRQLRSTRAAAVIVQRNIKLGTDVGRPVFLVEDADLAVARVLTALAPPIPRPPAGVDAMARVSPSAQLGEGCAVGPFVSIGQRVRAGRGCVFHPGVVVGDDCVLGDGCELFPNVVVRERITLGARVIIHAGSMIGSDGFGYHWDGKQHVKIPQIGEVIIEDDVEIGSCVCIDRAKFSTTVIGRGTKIDNLVQIAHNCRVGPHCIIVGQVGLAGSVQLGEGVTLGGQAAIRDHISVGDGAAVAACSGAAADVPARTVVSGTPAIPHRQTLREQAALRHLPDLVVKVRQLEEQLARLQGPDKE